MDGKAILMGISFAFIWASAFTATRFVVLGVPPLTALVIRFALSGLIGVGLAAAMGQSLRLPRAEWRPLVVFGVCQNALYLGCNWVAMQWIEASAAAIIASAMPLLVALAGFALLGERLRPLAVAGLVAGIAGVVLVMGVRLRHGISVPGVVLCVAGVVALTVATLAVRGAPRRTGPGVLMTVGLQMLVGSAALLLPALALEWGRPQHWTLAVAAGFAFSVLFPGLLATWIWLRLVVRVGAVRAATFHFLSPIFGVAIAALLLGERFGPVDLLGALVVAAGILMVQLSRTPAGAGAAGS